MKVIVDQKGYAWDKIRLFTLSFEIALDLLFFQCSRGEANPAF